MRGSNLNHTHHGLIPPTLSRWLAELPLLLIRWFIALVFPPLSVKIIRSFGRKGKGQIKGPQSDLRFNRPRDVCISSDNRTLYVCDSGNDRIVVVQADSGQCVRQIGKLGHGADEFDQPYSIALYDDRILFVCDYGNGRVQMIDAMTGVMYCEYSVGEHGPAHCALDSIHRLLYITNNSQSCIDVLSFDDVAHTMHLHKQISQLSTRTLRYPNTVSVGGTMNNYLFCTDLDFRKDVSNNMLLCIDMSTPTDNIVVYSVLPQVHDKCWECVEPRSLGVTPCGRRLFLSDGYRQRLLVFNAKNGRSLTGSYIRDGDTRTGFCFTSSTNNNEHSLFVCNSAKHCVEIITVRVRWPWSWFL